MAISKVDKQEAWHIEFKPQLIKRQHASFKVKIPDSEAVIMQDCHT